MRFVELPRFAREFRKLSPEARRRFIESFREFDAACDELLREPNGFEWPSLLRVEKLVGQRGIYAFTWSFARPDGRTTFEFMTIDGQPAVVLRRIGRHDIYKEP